MKQESNEKGFKRNLSLERISESGGKLPPQNIEIEEGIIGAILIDKKSFLEAQQFITSSDFYKEAHQRIFQAFHRLSLKLEPIDLLTTVQELRHTNELEIAGGASYLSRLSGKVVSSENIQFHCLILVQHSRKRSIISMAADLLQKAYNDGEDFQNILERVQSEVYKLSIANFQSRRSLDRVLNDTYKQITAAKHREIIGIPSRFTANNEITGGYKRKNLRIVAARPAMGKTLHLINEALPSALHGYSIAIFSLEMPSEEQMIRAISHCSQIEYKKLETGQLSEQEHDILLQWIRTFAGLRLEIDDTPNIDLLYLCSVIRMIKMRNEMADPTRVGLDAVYIDYLQLMAIKGENKNSEYGKITRTLKNLAKELDIAIILYSQLGRDVEKRGGDKRPMLSDLRDSGEIEQDADVVEFLYRPEYYKITQDESGNSTQGLLEIITQKNRQGGLGTTYVKFLPTVSTIANEDPRFNYNKF